jgi:hypothetical protein
MTNKKNKKYAITRKTLPTETTVTFKEVFEDKPASK